MENMYLLSSIIESVVSMIIIVSGIFVLKGSVGQATSAAQQNAISAMQSELESLRSRTDDLKEENSRLQHILQTICEALKIKGMIITINGEMVHIKDSGGSTSTRIQESGV